MAKFLCSVVCLCVPLLCHAGFKIGASVNGGAYFPTNPRTRDLFGGTWFQFGASSASRCPKSSIRLSPDFDYITRSSDCYNGFRDNSLTIIRVGVAAKMSFARKTSHIRPYAAVSIGPTYFNYDITTPAARVCRNALGIGGALEGGFYVRKRVQVYAKYQVYNSVRGLDFNGIGVGVSYRVF